MTTTATPRMVDVLCQRGHFIVAVPAGTPYRAYCHRCQRSENGISPT